MERSRSFRHFSESELDAVLQKISTEKHIFLDRALLRQLANDTGIRWYATGKKPGLLQHAKRHVFHASALTQRSESEEHRHDAYSSGVSMLFSARGVAAKARKAAQNRRPQSQYHPAPASPPYGFGEDGQGMFFFGRRTVSG